MVSLVGLLYAILKIGDSGRITRTEVKNAVAWMICFAVFVSLTLKMNKEVVKSGSVVAGRGVVLETFRTSDRCGYPHDWAVVSVEGKKINIEGRGYEVGRVYGIRKRDMP